MSLGGNGLPTLYGQLLRQNLHMASVTQTVPDKAQHHERLCDSPLWCQNAPSFSGFFLTQWFETFCGCCLAHSSAPCQSWHPPGQPWTCCTPKTPCSCAKASLRSRDRQTCTKCRRRSSRSALGPPVSSVPSPTHSSMGRDDACANLSVSWPQWCFCWPGGCQLWHGALEWVRQHPQKVSNHCVKKNPLKEGAFWHFGIWVLWHQSGLFQSRSRH